jgi:hypothetical protein
MIINNNNNKYYNYQVKDKNRKKINKNNRILNKDKISIGRAKACKHL